MTFIEQSISPDLVFFFSRLGNSNWQVDIFISFFDVFLLELSDVSTSISTSTMEPTNRCFQTTTGLQGHALWVPRAGNGSTEKPSFRRGIGDQNGPTFQEDDKNIRFPRVIDLLYAYASCARNEDENRMMWQILLWRIFFCHKFVYYMDFPAISALGFSQVCCIITLRRDVAAQRYIPCSDPGVRPEEMVSPPVVW